MQSSRSHPTSSAADLLTRAASLLFVNGQSSESTAETVRRFGAGLGVKADLLLRWGEIILFVDGRETMQIIPAKPTAVDMGRVTATLRVIDDVCAGRKDPRQADVALDEIAHLPPVHVLRFALLAALGAAALGVIFGAANVATLVTIALIAGGGALLRRAVSHLSSNPLPQPFCAAFLAGAAGLFAIRSGIGVDARLVLVCPCMVLVPGPHVLNGTIDLARARITIGCSRLVFAGLVVLMISAGLLIGLSLADVELPTTAPAVAVPLLHDVVSAGLAVAAYGTFFNMPWRMLPIPIGVGMLAHSSHWLLLSWGLGLPLSSLSACLVVGLIVAPVADRLHYPFAALAFAAVVSMVPGVFLFDGAAALVALTEKGAEAPPQLLVSAVASITNALLIILAMTVGLIVPKMAFEALKRGGVRRA